MGPSKDRHSVDFQLHDQSTTSQLSESELRRRKQTLERAKANHLSRQLQMRLQYARLKVDHGWQKQTLNEVENLYFHHSHRRPTPSATVSSISRTAPSYPALNFPASHQSKTPVSYKSKSRTGPHHSLTAEIADPNLIEGIQTITANSDMNTSETPNFVPPAVSLSSTHSLDQIQIEDDAEPSQMATTSTVPTKSALLPLQPSFSISEGHSLDASSSTKPPTDPKTKSPKSKKRPHTIVHPDTPPTHTHIAASPDGRSYHYQPPSSSSVPPESTSTFRVAPKRPRYGTSPSSSNVGNGSSAGGGTGLGIADGRGVLTYDSFWSNHGAGVGSERNTTTASPMVGRFVARGNFGLNRVVTGTGTEEL